MEAYDKAICVDGARLLSDYQLDEMIAMFDARTRVAVAYGQTVPSEHYGELTALLAGVRAERAAMGRAVDEAFTCADDVADDSDGLCDNG